MDGLIPAMIAFPTVVFTILLGLVAIYWTTVIVAGLDVDILDLDASVDANASETLTALGLRGVPVTVWLSFFVLIAWVALLLASVFVGPFLQAVTGSLVSSTLIAVAGMTLSAVLTSFAVRPVRRLFTAPVGPKNLALVGKVCTITTMRVDGGFGQAEIADGGAGLLVQVRAAEPNNLTRGSHALVFEYDNDEGVYHITEVEHGPDLRAMERRLESSQ
ncbi:MAG: hypothetical protein IPF53_02030 [Blastocatellia bacterium]|jgi:hypothetical protein|nr:hypothetical protein [Blastocatellia bacterium]